MMDYFFEAASRYIWGPGTLVLILIAGIIITIKTGFIQVRHLKTGFKLLFFEKNGGNAFTSLCTALSASMGTGNIIGACIAVSIGGPGAVFWMWLSAFFGMAIKYYEGYNAVQYRNKGNGKDTENSGGPFLYMEKGIGGIFKKAAKLFALCAISAALFGIGTITQINSVYSSAVNLFGYFKLLPFICGGISACLAGIVVFGGSSRIRKITVYLVPAMALIYINGCFLSIISHIEQLPEAFEMIFKYAFTGNAATGGFVGAGFTEALRMGVSRGIFANESGLGSSPIAAAASKENSPEKQGIVMMTGTIFDTFLVCTLTALSAIVTGAWQNGKNGVETASDFLKSGFSLISGSYDEYTAELFLFLCLCLFALSSVIGWNFYGRSCAEYLFGKKHTGTIYNTVCIIIIFLSPFISSRSVWYIADIFNGIMTFINLTALIILSTKKQNIKAYGYKGIDNEIKK